MLRVRAAAATLPAVLSDRLCLECRLDPRDTRTDLVIGVEAAGRAILCGDNPAIALHPAVTRAGPWKQVRDFCRAWADPASPLHEGVERLWLEFDISGDADPAESRPLPGVFLDFAESACASGPPEERCGYAVLALRSLLGTEPSPAVTGHLLRCLRALPEGACIPYVGVLIPRGTDLVRLCVMGLGEERLCDYLRAVGWTGPYASLAALLERVRASGGGSASPSMALVHLDVGSDLLPKVGLEFAFARSSQVRGRLHEPGFLDLLVEEGFCTAPKRRVLLAWPGCEPVRLPHELWPSLALRHLAHVKIVVDAGGPREAKAYLSLRHTPRGRRNG
jgi:hypothetical protein